MNKTTLRTENNTLVLERIFPTSKEQLWETWKNPELFSKWWGPRGWNTRVKESAFTSGGSILYGMMCEDENQQDWYGKEVWGKMTFESVTPYDEFVYTDYFTDEIGTIDESMPVVRTVNTLEPVENGTKFTSIGYYDSPEDLKTVLDMGMAEGITQTWDRLEELLLEINNGLKG